MCGTETDGAGVTMHDGAILTGGTIPPHVPGAYPSLSCCGGPVLLVPVRHDPYGLVPIPAPETPPEPIIPEGPGWIGAELLRDGEAANATVYLEPYAGEHTRAELWIHADPHTESDRSAEAGAELTLDDLAALILAAATIGAAAGLADGHHRAALYFERAAEAMRLMEPYA